MPSTHSSSIAYFGTYLSLSSILLPLHPRVTSLFPFYSYLAPLGPGAVEPSFWRNLATEWGERVTRLSMATFFLAGAASVCWSRVRLGHHTPAQVLVGASLGSAVALTWLLLWLGVTEAGTLGGFGVTGLGGMVPGWLVGGIREQGMVWERAVEDAMFVAFEAWQDRNWKGLKTLRSFPVAEL
jgi:dolichyldiphosphatase